MQHLKEFNFVLMEIALFFGIHVNAIFTIKCIEATGVFSIFEVSLYYNYLVYSNKSNKLVELPLMIQIALVSDVWLWSYSV